MTKNNAEILREQLERKSYFLEEMALMTVTGSYSINVITNQVYLDAVGIRILGLPDDFKGEMFKLIEFFADPEQGKRMISQCLAGQPFLIDLQMKRYNGSTFWARGSGNPVYDENDEVIGIKGVFTSIDRFVQNAQKANKNMQIIRAQNDRLLHFAHIVSHNLRSHASNLQLTINTFRESEDVNEDRLFVKYLDTVSQNLNQTLEHLNDVLTVHTVRKRKEVVVISDVFNVVFERYQQILTEIGGSVDVNFNDLNQIRYVPSFLENIFDNLLSNSIRFRDMNKPLRVTITSYRDEKGEGVQFTDNGIGIDLVKNGEKIFKMYKTFHTQQASIGVGLFMIKNQVEALGGDISVNSAPNEGCTFVLKF